MAARVLAQNNFLIPNATILAELVAFLVILAVLYRFVVPPVQRAMRQRDEVIRTQFEEAEQARERSVEAEATYRKALNEARAEAAQIRESARAEGQRILDGLRATAQREADRTAEEGRRRLAADRESILRELRVEMGTVAVDLAGRVVGESLAEEARRAGTVAAFLAELEGAPAAQAQEQPSPQPAAAGSGDTG